MVAFGVKYIPFFFKYESRASAILAGLEDGIANLMGPDEMMCGTVFICVGLLAFVSYYLENTS